MLDLANFVAAPVAATMLGDFGADVVKVEQPGAGDVTRWRAAEPGARSLMWLQEARNRRCMAIDLRTERGQELVHALVPRFDVVVNNFRPSTLRKWRLDPESLQAVHPDGVLVYITGFGLTGPHADRGALDRVASAFSGVSHVTGEPDRPPTRAGFALLDYMTGYLGAFGAMLALYHRDVHGGGGQVIDLGLFEGGFRASEDSLIDYVVNGVVRERIGSRNVTVVPADEFDTRDGRRISVHAGTEALFRRLVLGAMKQPELLDDPRFATYPARCEHQDDLYGLIAAWIGQHDCDDIARILAANDIPHSPIMSVADIIGDPHYAARGLIQWLEDSEFGRVAMPGPVPHLSKTPGSVRTLGPALGSDTDDILTQDLGLTPTEIHQLRHTGTIG